MIRVFLIGCLISGLAFPLKAEVSDDLKMNETVKANVIDFRDWLMKMLAQMPKTEARSFHHSNSLTANKKRQCFTAKQYNQAAKSNWAKAQLMQGLSILSQQLANTVGTAYAPQSAGQLQQYATQLQQSDDPQFQQVGALYNQEAQAIQTGNVQAADQSATQVASVQAPYVAPGYQPSQIENSQVQAFNQGVGSVIASLGGILGTIAVAAILTELGVPQLAPALMGVFSTGSTALNGNTSTLGTTSYSASTLSSFQNTGNYVMTGSNMAQNASVSLQQLGSVNVKPLQSQGSSNASSAPPAQ